MKMIREEAPRRIAGVLRLLAGAVAVIPFDLTAQTTKVTGRVYDAATKEPLPFVNVAFVNSRIGTATDFDGNYVLETYFATDSLRVTSMGYTSVSMRVKRDVEQRIDIPLQAASEVLHVVE